jgi:hypothetical protein
LRSERGTTLIELMIAGAIILVAIVGFIATMNEAARSSAVAQRRTVSSHVRTALVERLAVTQRERLLALPADEWRIDACYDGWSRLVAQNATLAAGFACPDGSLYRSWLRIEPSAERTWAVRAYAERMDAGCAAADRYRSLSCVPADVLLTD